MPDHPVYDETEHGFLHREQAARAALAEGARTFAGWFDLHHDTAAVPVAASPKENDMTGNDLRSLADSLDTLGDGGLGKTVTILGKPETAEGHELLAQIASLNIPPAEVTQALGGLRAQVLAYTRAAQRAQQEAAGQPA